MKTVIAALALVSAAAAAGCHRTPDVDRVPVGSDVQLTRADGALVEGTLVGRDQDAVTVDVGPATRSVPREAIADLRLKDAEKPAPPRAAKFREITLPAETPLAIRLDTSVSTSTSAVESPVHGTLAESIVRNGVTVVPAGAVVRGAISSVRPSGRVKGRASISMAFDDLAIGGTHHAIDARFARTAPAGKSRDAKTIGIPAAGGAVLGAILGGKKGAAIGAAAGGGAGTAVVLTTPGRDISLQAGTLLSLHAGRVLTVRVPLS
jgi:hypothetical protein